MCPGGSPPTGCPGGSPPTGCPGGSPPTGCPGGSPPTGCPGGSPPTGCPGGSPPTGVGRRATASRLGLAAFLVAAGALHFVVPRGYERIVPRVLGHAPLLVAATGVAEIVSGVLVAVPRTRRLGAGLAFALLLLVWPANVQMAVDGGIPGAGFPAGSALVSWARVPLQVPLLVWAWRQARRPSLP